MNYKNVALSERAYIESTKSPGIHIKTMDIEQESITEGELDNCLLFLNSNVQTTRIESLNLLFSYCQNDIRSVVKWIGKKSIGHLVGLIHIPDEQTISLQIMLLLIGYTKLDDYLIQEDFISGLFHVLDMPSNEDSIDISFLILSKLVKRSKKMRMIIYESGIYKIVNRYGELNRTYSDAFFSFLKSTLEYRFFPPDIYIMLQPHIFTLFSSNDESQISLGYECFSHIMSCVETSEYFDKEVVFNLVTHLSSSSISIVSSSLSLLSRLISHSSISNIFMSSSFIEHLEKMDYIYVIDQFYEFLDSFLVFCPDHFSYIFPFLVTIDYLKDLKNTLFKTKSLIIRFLRNLFFQLPKDSSERIFRDELISELISNIQSENQDILLNILYILSEYTSISSSQTKILISNEITRDNLHEKIEELVSHDQKLEFLAIQLYSNLGFSLQERLTK